MKQVEHLVVKALTEAGIADGRIYGLTLDQGSELPAVMYQRVHTEAHNTFLGYQGETVTIMINSFADTYPEAKAVARGVRKALAPLGQLVEEQDIYGEDTDVFCVSAEFEILQIGGFCHG